MISRDLRHAQNVRARHRWHNRLQTVLLVLTLLGIAAVAGSLLLVTAGFSWRLRLRGSPCCLNRRPPRADLAAVWRTPLHPDEAPDLWAVLRELAARAGLPTVPVPHYVPSGAVNAFATGSKHHAAIALTDGLLRSLTPRELTGVLGHEIAHIANEDLRVMGLADSISRLTHLLALLGQLAIVLSLPTLLLGVAEVNWPALLYLRSRHSWPCWLSWACPVREFDADRLAAELTGDPHGLASALAKIERVSRSWRAWLLPGWGNPEPSWLRTHPATAERIERLLELSSAARDAAVSIGPFRPRSDRITTSATLALATFGADFNMENDVTYPTPTAARSRIDSSGAGSSSLAASPHSCCCGSSCPPSKPGSVPTKQMLPARKRGLRPSGSSVTDVEPRVKLHKA